jgi:hypothetical protein
VGIPRPKEEAVSEHEHEQKSEPEEREETLEDLEVAETDAEDVKGGLGQKWSADK